MTQNILQKQDLHKADKWDVLQWLSQSPDLNPAEHAFQWLKGRQKEAERPTNKLQLKAAALQAWQTISKERSLTKY